MKTLVWVIGDRESFRFYADKLQELLNKRKLSARVRFFPEFRIARHSKGKSPDFVFIDIASLTGLFGFNNPWGYGLSQRLRAFVERHSASLIAFWTAMGHEYSTDFAREARDITGRTDLKSIGWSNRIWDKMANFIRKYSPTDGGDNG